VQYYSILQRTQIDWPIPIHHFNLVLSRQHWKLLILEIVCLWLLLLFMGCSLRCWVALWVAWDLFWWTF